MRIAVIVSVLLILSGCASAPPPPRPAAPAWEAVPAAVLDALCARLLDDGIGSSGATIAVTKTTQPIATAQAIVALGAMTRGNARSSDMAEALRAGQRAIPVQLGGAGCAWRSIAALDATRHADAMVVEISAPFVNPFGRGEPGLFARASLGGTHPSWYWIPVANFQGTWVVGRVLPLIL